MSDGEWSGRWPWDRQRSALSERRRRRRALVALALAVVLAAWCASFYDYTRSFHAQPGVQPSLLDPRARGVVAEIAVASARRLLAPFLPDPTPRLYLEIEPRHLEKIIAKREQALQRHFLITAPDDFVPATLRHDGRTVRVRVRLKGDLTDHLEGDKWSFRV